MSSQKPTELRSQIGPLEHLKVDVGIGRVTKSFKVTMNVVNSLHNWVLNVTFSGKALSVKPSVGEVTTIDSISWEIRSASPIDAGLFGLDVIFEYSEDSRIEVLTVTFNDTIATINNGNDSQVV